MKTFKVKDSKYLNSKVHKFDEDKFFVLKYKDIRFALTENQQMEFEDLVNKINQYRKFKHKKIDNKYLIINVDEPYAYEVADIMAKHGHSEDEYPKCDNCGEPKGFIESHETHYDKPLSTKQIISGMGPSKVVKHVTRHFCDKCNKDRLKNCKLYY